MFEAEPGSDGRIEPYCEITYLETPRIKGAVFSADGKTIYILTIGKSINVWAILVYWWPEAMGAMAGLSVAAFTIIVRRVVRQKQDKGRPYCRQCGYCLQSLVEDRCPECGVNVSVKKPVIGRSTRRRILPWGVACAMIVGGYAALHVAQVSRRGTASAWLNWWSFDLLSWATDNNKPWLISRASFVNRVLEVDVGTGETIRTIFAGGGYAQLPLVRSPDGLRLFLTGYPSELRMLDVPSGRVSRTLLVEGSLESVGGFSDDGETIYVAVLDRDAEVTRLMAWDWDTDEKVILLELDAEVHRTGHGRRMLQAQRFYRVPGRDPQLMIQYPHGYGVHQNTVELVVRDLDIDAAAVGMISTTIWPRSSPMFSADGERMLVQTWDRIEEWNLRSGERITNMTGTLRLPHLDVLQPFLDRGRHRLYVGVRGSLVKGGVRPRQNQLWVIDLRENRVIGRLANPYMPSFESMEVSPDGKTLLTVCIKGKDSRGNWSSRVYLYDLSALGEDPGQQDEQVPEHEASPR
ncbi:MAG: hypothetical protein IID37_05400 [Planctomycetes bacterium]|nr:hypothetical protein [Planctomycetota bacterium]